MPLNPQNTSNSMYVFHLREPFNNTSFSFCLVEMVFVKGEPDEVALDDHTYAFRCYSLAPTEENPLEKHIKIHMCALCGVTFDRLTLYMAHKKNIHNSNPIAVERESYCCPNCPAKFNKERSYMYHMKKLCGKTCKCHHCSRTFKYPNHLINHSRWGCRVKIQESIKNQVLIIMYVLRIDKKYGGS